MLPEEISSEWTAEEREIIKRKISALLLVIPLMNFRRRADLKLKITYLNTQPAVFLETNRKEFLKYL